MFIRAIPQGRVAGLRRAWPIARSARAARAACPQNPAVLYGSRLSHRRGQKGSKRPSQAP